MNKPPIKSKVYMTRFLVNLNGFKLLRFATLYSMKWLIYAKCDETKINTPANRDSRDACLLVNDNAIWMGLIIWRKHAHEDLCICVFVYVETKYVDGLVDRQTDRWIQQYRMIDRQRCRWSHRSSFNCRWHESIFIVKDPNYIIDLNSKLTYLVGGLEHEFHFPISWEFHNPNWRAYFSEELKPPTSYWTTWQQDTRLHPRSLMGNIDKLRQFGVPSFFF